MTTDEPYHNTATGERVTFTEKGKLDEVYSAKGAHLECIGGADWFLAFYNEDGTSSAFWFSSKDLRKPFWERRPAPTLPQPPESTP